MQLITIQYKRLTMYPYYYPFAGTFCFNQFPSYHYEVSDFNQFFTIAQQFILEQKNEKNEDVNTSYSVNGSNLHQLQHSEPRHNPPTQKDFLHSNDEYRKSQKRIQNGDQLQFKLKTQHLAKDQNQRLRYINKNFQSNIINKIFSFLWSQDKSRNMVSRILKDKTKVVLYFEYMKIIRKYCKRYINKEYLKDLCNYHPQHIAYRIVARHTEKLKYFSMEELSQTIRRLIYIYLRDVCSLSILTSKKMRTDIWRDHFEKTRNIYQFLFEGLSSDQYDQRMSQSYDKIYNNSKILTTTTEK